MMLLGMNSKRQRRPNVRLGEIGDSAAAFRCINSIRPRQSLEEKRCKYEREKEIHKEIDSNHIFGDPRETDSNPIFGDCVLRSEFTVSDPGEQVLVDNLHNLENWNPNSSEVVAEFAKSDETDIASEPKLDFGDVTRKGRVTRRRGSSTRGKRRVAGKTWCSSFSSEFADKNENEYVGKSTTTEYLGEDAFHGNDKFHDGDDQQDDKMVYLLDQDTSVNGKEAYENDWVKVVSDPLVPINSNTDELFISKDHDVLDSGEWVKAISDIQVEVDSDSTEQFESKDHDGSYSREWVKAVSNSQMAVGSNSDELLLRNESKNHDAYYSGDYPCMSPGSTPGADKVGFGGNVVHSVNDWLEEIGFRNYAGLFEVHEVDEEVLPQLTIDDLKEMGISAVGTRRKLYSAIQLLSAGNVSAGRSGPHR